MSNTASVATGPSPPVFGLSCSTSATASTTIHSKQRKRTKESSKQSFTNRANRLLPYPSIQQEPDLIGFASATSNAPNDPTPASLPNGSSGPSASTSVIQFTAAPDLLTADLGSLSTSSDAANFTLSEHLGPLAYASSTTNITATPSDVLFGLSGSASATVVNDALAAEVDEQFTPPKKHLKRQSVIPHIPLFSALLTSHLCSSAYANTTTVSATPSHVSSVFNSGTFAIAADDTLAIEVEALFTSSAAGPSHPTFDLSAGASTAESTTIGYILASGYEAISIHLIKCCRSLSTNFRLECQYLRC